MRKAMLTSKAMSILNLKPSFDPAVTDHPTPWSLTCNVRLKTDASMVAQGYQQWLRAGQTLVLEDLTSYPPGMAQRAVDEAAGAARSCTSYAYRGLSISVVGPVSVTGRVLHFCQQLPRNFACTRDTVRGNYVSEVFAFGSSAKSALALTNFVAGLADAQQSSVGL